MMRQIFFLLLIMIQFIWACSNNSKSANEFDEYSGTLSFFRDSLIDHFPKYVPDKKNISEHLDTNGYHNTLSFRLTVYDSKDEIDTIVREINNKIIGEYKSTDSCLLVVNNYITSKNCGDPFRARQSTFIEGCSNNKYPVPNFWSDDLATDSTRSKLPTDFVFYVLDSKVGVFSKKINVEQTSMPLHMEHGYSKGLAISRERSIIIYWVIVW